MNIAYYIINILIIHFTGYNNYMLCGSYRNSVVCPDLLACDQATPFNRESVSEI